MRWNDYIGFCQLWTEEDKEEANTNSKWITIFEMYPLYTTKEK